MNLRPLYFDTTMARKGPCVQDHTQRETRAREHLPSDSGTAGLGSPLQPLPYRGMTWRKVAQLLSLVLNVHYQFLHRGIKESINKSRSFPSQYSTLLLSLFLRLWGEKWYLIESQKVQVSFSTKTEQRATAALYRGFLFWGVFLSMGTRFSNYPGRL